MKMSEFNKLASRSDYSWNVIDNTLYIVDKNLGSMSVTNNIENIVFCISLIEHKVPTDYKIIYKDSEGIWSKYDFINDTFISISQQLENLF